jgi:hypothetical protein
MPVTVSESERAPSHAPLVDFDRFDLVVWFQDSKLDQVEPKRTRFYLPDRASLLTLPLSRHRICN